jgi:hypothetical protein
MQSKVSGTDTGKSGAKPSKSRKNTQKDPVTNEKRKIDRREMIATAAYYRAEKRGFKGDETDAVEDWLEAEMEIDNELDMQDVNGLDFRFIIDKIE